MRYGILLLAALAGTAQQPPLRPIIASSTEGGAVPKPATSTAAKAAARAAADHGDLKFGQLHTPATPNVVRFQLSNGLKVLLLENHELPSVSGQAIVRAGSLSDPTDRAGLAQIAGALLRAGGSRNRNPEDVDNELDRLGATLESRVGDTASVIAFSSPSEGAEGTIAIVRDLLTTPAFRRDRLDLLKSGMLTAVSRRNDRAWDMLRREFGGLLYGAGFVRRPEFASVRRIERTDVEAFSRRFFRPAATTLTISGDFAPDTMRRSIESAFGEWKSDAAPEADAPKGVYTERLGAHLAWKRDLREGLFLVGRLSPELSSPDSPPLDVLAEILGGSGRTRLGRVVAGSRGAIRQLRAEHLGGQGRPGMLFVSGASGSLQTGDAVAAVFAELERLRGVELTEEEVRVAREAAILRLWNGFDDPAKALSAIALLESNGYAPGFVEEYTARLAAVTRSDIARVARQWLERDKFTIAAAANVMNFDKPLDPRGGAVQPIDLTIPEPAVETTRNSSGDDERGHKLLARAQQAAGGAQKLAAVKDFVSDTLYKLADGADDHEIDQWIAPSVLRQNGDTSRYGTVIRFFDGRSGWISNGRASVGANAFQLRLIRGDLQRLFIPLLLSDRVPGTTIGSLDWETVEIVQGDQICRVTFDAVSGLPEGLSYELVLDKGQLVLVREEYSDFREVNGLKLPFHIRVLQNGLLYADGLVSGYKWNEGLKIETLQKRP